MSEDTKTQNLNESNTWKHLFNNFIDGTFLFSLTNQKNLFKFFVEFDANDKISAWSGTMRLAGWCYPDAWIDFYIAKSRIWPKEKKECICCWATAVRYDRIADWSMKSTFYLVCAKIIRIGRFCVSGRQYTQNKTVKQWLYTAETYCESFECEILWNFYARVDGWCRCMWIGFNIVEVLHECEW